MIRIQVWLHPLSGSNWNIAFNIMNFLCQFMGRVKVEKKKWTLLKSRWHGRRRWSRRLTGFSGAWVCAKGCSGKSNTGLGNKSSWTPNVGNELLQLKGTSFFEKSLVWLLKYIFLGSINILHVLMCICIYVCTYICVILIFLLLR